MHAARPRGEGSRPPVRGPIGGAIVALALAAGCAAPRAGDRRPPPAPAGDEPEPAVTAEPSHLVPALEILGFDLLLNLYDRHFIDAETYGSDLDSIEENLERGFDLDRDPFGVNQIGHPYQGAMYHGFARSAGLGFWTAFVYDTVASAAWEVAGETSQPSLNDQITTPLAGSFLGEALFRMAALVLGEDGEPGPWRELGAAAVSPPTGFNRLFFERFDGVYPSRGAPVFARAGVGARRNASIEDVGALDDVAEDGALASFALDYGLPGAPGYDYERPFDYFSFQATLTTSAEALPENVLVRGLLLGTDHRWSDSVRGIWGLYGSYDYVAPELFSVSSSALSLGSTAQWSASDTVALQGTVLAGVGWTAIGTLADAREDRDYRFGVSPQGLVELRLLLGRVAALEIAGREYHLFPTDSDVAEEDVLRGEARLTVRVWGRHAVALQFVASRRDADLLELDDALASVGALSVLYTYLGDESFGRVHWPRPAGAHAR